MRRGHRTYLAVTLPIFGFVGLLLLPSGVGGAAAGAPPLTPALSWTELPPGTSPPACYAGSMVYDAHAGFVLYFGGFCRQGANWLPTNATWTFASGGWTRLAPARSPSARGYSQLSYDPANGHVVLFGGMSGCSMYTATCPALGDTWVFSNGTWTNLSAKLPTAPPARYAGAMACSGGTPQCVLFGGLGTSGNPVYNATWGFTRGAWTNLTYPRSPTNFGSEAATEVAHGRLLFYGAELYNSQLWAFSGGWTELSAVHTPPIPAHAPPPMGSTTLTYAPFPGRPMTVLVGGLTQARGCPTRICLNDSWEDRSGHWTQYTSGPSPQRYLTSVAYDARTSTLVLFGGIDTSDLASNETWTFR